MMFCLLCKDTDLLQSLGHHIWSVVDGENDVSDTGGSERFDLVQNHRSVRKLDQWLRESKGLRAEVSEMLINSESQ